MRQHRVASAEGPFATEREEEDFCFCWSCYRDDRNTSPNQTRSAGSYCSRTWASTDVGQDQLGECSSCACLGIAMKRVGKMHLGSGRWTEHARLLPRKKLVQRKIKSFLHNDKSAAGESTDTPQANRCKQNCV
jgi:hypothetical protein